MLMQIVRDMIIIDLRTLRLEHVGVPSVDFNAIITCDDGYMKI